MSTGCRGLLELKARANVFQAASRDVPELAALLHPAENPTIDEVIRKEAARRAKEAEGSTLYIHHKNLLQHVLANRDPREMNPP